MGWDRKPDLFAELVEEEAEKRWRAFALTCLNAVVLRSPVDTGAAVIRGVSKGAFPPVYIQTNLPYAARLENGWSQQAADGVYAVSFNYAVQKFR